jgi:hypothetical protein
MMISTHTYALACDRLSVYICKVSLQTEGSDIVVNRNRNRAPHENRSTGCLHAHFLDMLALVISSRDDATRSTQ